MPGRFFQMQQGTGAVNMLGSPLQQNNQIILLSFPTQTWGGPMESR